MIFTRKCSIKINLTLRVFQRREDGYHDISSLFWRRPSPESLEVEPVGEADCLSVEGIDIQGENLLLKACRALRSWHGESSLSPLRMRLSKCLPPGSGVGAGSGNAAELLRWFYSTCGRDDVKFAITEKIASLGADVAFLTSGYSLALADGRGERLEKCVLPGGQGESLDIPAVIFFPRWSSATVDAYASLDRARGDASFFWAVNPAEAREESLAVLSGLVAGERLGLLPNDFLTRVCNYEELYSDLYEAIENTGALAWGLCGSGSACFALFSEKDGADVISDLLSRLSFEESSRFAWLYKTLVLE
jgi:4-diphosphocytidyl-2-C-methyl-D-erythritol kinase